MQDPHDAGGTFVARRLEIEARYSIRLIGRAHNRGRSGVRHFGEQCAQGDAQSGVLLAGDLRQLVGVGAPSQLRFAPHDDEHLGVAAWDRRDVDLRCGPVDLSMTGVVETYMWAR